MRSILITLLLAIPTFAFGQSEFTIGLFHTPLPEAASREALWQHCEEAGVRDLFVKTFANGFTIYPSNPESTFEQQPELEGVDLLSAYIDEGHQRGIRVHAWVDIFLWDVDREAHPEAPLHQFSDRHEWRVIDQEGRTPRPLFVSPAINDVANRVQVLCLEIIHFHPEIDGILLDQFRYPGGSDFTYDSAAVWEFMQMGNNDPREEPIEDERALWREFIEGKLGLIAEQIHLLMHGIHQGEITISLLAFPPTDDDLRYQAWPTWAAEGSLDAVVPMCFEADVDAITEAAMESAAAIDTSRVPMWVGLAVQPGSERPELQDQLNAIQDLPVQGVVIFNARWMDDNPVLYETLGEWATAR